MILQTYSFSLQKALTDGLEWCGLLWCFNQLFGLSFWRHPLVNKWWTAQCFQICSDEETNWSDGEDIFKWNHFSTPLPCEHYNDVVDN